MLHAPTETMNDHNDDLSTVIGSRNVPFWFSQGHIRDDLSTLQQAGPDAKLPYVSPSSDNSVKYLSAVQKPEVGMRTYTSVYSLDGTDMRLTGMITSIGEEPSPEDLSRSGSLFWGLLSEHPNFHYYNAMTLDEKKTFISQFVGGVHGQRVTSVAMLSEEQGGQAACHHLLPQHSIVEIVYKFNDNMYYPWTVESYCVLDSPALATSPEISISSYLNAANRFHQDITSTALNWQANTQSPITTLMNDATIALIGDPCSSNHQDWDNSVCSKQLFYC
jgi:hypothetical protein